MVASLCVDLAETLNVIGPAFLEGSEWFRVIFSQLHLIIPPEHDTVCNIAIRILEQKVLCQQEPDQDEEDEPLEDQAEYDSVLISSAGDLVSALANALGSDFTQAFQTFFPLISKFCVRARLS